jgi:hypothetical protein
VSPGNRPRHNYNKREHHRHHRPPPTITVRLPAGADAAPQLLDLAAAPWYGDLPETAPPTRIDIDGTVYPPLPDFTPGTLPNAPISLVREGWLRGIRLGVYTINPVYLQDGQPLQIGRLTALIPDAEPLDQAPQPADNGPFLAAAPAPDPAAAQAGWRIRVTAGGIQSLDAATLIAAGLDPASVDVSRLQLHFNGNQIAMHEIRSGGSLTALRFYAPAPSDRWNSNDSYWLRLGSSAGLRMNSLAAAPAGGPVSTTALERGVWRDYVSLESRLPGPDGDTFFSADLRAVAGELSQTATAAIRPQLPAAAGPISVTLSGQSLYNNDHLVQVAIGGNEQTATWSGNTPWSESFQFPAFAGSATITLLTAPAVADDRVHFDSMQWEVPVQLNLNGQGAEFFGRSGRWRYQFSNPPAGATLYTVDDPTRPVILNGAGNGFEVEGNGGEHYVLAGPGTLHTPAIEAYTPTTIAQPRSATAVYIAPAVFSEPSHHWSHTAETRATPSQS